MVPGYSLKHKEGFIFLERDCEISETFVFRDDKMWRIEGENHYSPAFVSSWKLKGPLDVRSYWADLPSRIDAVYRVPELPGITWANGNTRFFSGSQSGLKNQYIDFLK